MNYLKNLLRSLGITILMILFLTLFLTTLSYFNLFKEGITNVMKIIIPIVSLFTGGIMMGKKAMKRGWLEGLKIGSIMCLFILLFNYLGLSHQFEAKNLLYYGILLISSVFGSMIGINKSQKKNS